MLSNGSQKRAVSGFGIPNSRDVKTTFSAEASEQDSKVIEHFKVNHTTSFNHETLPS
jgi:hypothetical protein